MRFERVSGKQLGELLIERGVLDRAALASALEHKKNHPDLLLGEILVNSGKVTEEDIVQALTSQYGFPYLPLGNYEIDKETLAVIPRSLCWQYCLIPIDRIGKSLTLAISNPLNLEALEDVELLTGCATQVFVSTSRDIRDAIKRYYGPA